MTLPQPDQVRNYPSVYLMLTGWLWDHPDGGIFKVGQKGHNPAMLERLRTALKDSGWRTEEVVDSGFAAIKVAVPESDETPTRVHRPDEEIEV